MNGKCHRQDIVRRWDKTFGPNFIITYTPLSKIFPRNPIAACHSCSGRGYESQTYANSRSRSQGLQSLVPFASKDGKAGARIEGTPNSVFSVPRSATEELNRGKPVNDCRVNRVDHARAQARTNRDNRPMARPNLGPQFGSSRLVRALQVSPAKEG